MNEPGSTENSADVPQIFGERVIGLVDPRTLTPEEFESSPDLLFHGSSRPFKFSRNFDYRDETWLEIDEGSSKTLGFGFYATDRENAVDYSNVRAGFAVGEAQPHVTDILPYQARMLDIRSKNNLSENAPLPREFVDKWISFYKTSIENTDRYKDIKPVVKPHLERMDTDYVKFLDNLHGEQATVLKRLLRTNEFPGPYWTYTFQDFMKSEGYDGLICIERSERHREQNVTTYVFYNLDKIGTYETWHEEPETVK